MPRSEIKKKKNTKQHSVPCFLPRRFHFEYAHAKKEEGEKREKKKKIRGNGDTLENHGTKET